MLPVILYVLTMNNFFNKSSIQKRVTRNEKSKRKNEKNRGDKKTKKWEGPDDDPRYAIHHSITTVLCCCIKQAVKNWMNFTNFSAGAHRALTGGSGLDIMLS